MAASAGCGHSDNCELVPSTDTFATLRLSCVQPDLRSVTVSGPCTSGDSGPPYQVYDSYVTVSGPPSPGVCHVDLVFGTGFTFATDLSFVSQSSTSCGDTVTLVGPSPIESFVDNPPATCSDAGLDGGPPDGMAEGGNDLGSDANDGDG